MSIKQFNVTYHPYEDRVILRFNTLDHSEFKFWLTRRVTHIILKSTAQLFENEHNKHTPSVENIISESKQPDSNTAFTKQYESGAQYPLGADAILVIDAKCGIVKNEDEDVVALDFQLPGGGNVNLKFPIATMKKVVLLLEESTIHAEWGQP